MGELIFDSVPSGAEVQIDGIIVGTTPMTYPIDEKIGLEEFRAECLFGGAVSCDWATLHTRLINYDVSRFWWFLTESERRSIAEMSIKNTLFYNITRGRSGKCDCAGGEGDTKIIVCLQNSVIRYIKFTSQSFGISDKCYYRQYESSDEFCYVPDESYGLPGHLVSCSTPAGHDKPFGHNMCAIQINPDISKLDSWIVFQYSTYDIKPGSWQMPLDTSVRLHIPDYSSSCGGYGSYTVAEFFI